jgi:hypothetical protein
VPNNFLPTFYDARNNKLYGNRPDGTFAYVDPNPKTRYANSLFIINPSDQNNIVEVEVPANQHYIAYLPDSTLDNFVPNEYALNSEIQLVNIGTGTLEVASMAYAFDVKSANGAQLTGQYAEAKLRCRGEQDWIVNGEVGPTNAKRYTVTNSDSGAYLFTGEGLTDEPNPSITLISNQELILTVNAPGHPLWIKSTQTTGAGSTAKYSSIGDHDNNGTDSGVLRYRPWVSSSPKTYYYNCQYHSSMSGSITISLT